MAERCDITKPSRRLFLAGSTAVAVVGAPLAIEPMFGVVAKFNKALAAFQEAIANEQAVHARFDAIAHEPPPYERQSDALAWRSGNGAKLDCTPRAVAHLRERIAELRAAASTEDCEWNRELLANCEHDLSAIETYRAERARLQASCGIDAASRVVEEAGTVLDALVEQIMAREPVSLIHLAAQARVVMHGLHDSDAVNFPERVIAFCDKQTRQLAA